MNDSKAVRITKGLLALVLLVPVALGVSLGLSISSPVVVLVSLGFALFPVAVLHEAVRNRPLYDVPASFEDGAFIDDAVKRDREFWMYYDPANPASPAGIHRRHQDELANQMNDALHRQHGIT